MNTHISEGGGERSHRRGKAYLKEDRVRYFAVDLWCRHFVSVESQMNCRVRKGLGFREGDPELGKGQWTRRENLLEGLGAVKQDSSGNGEQKLGRAR